MKFFQENIKKFRQDYQKLEQAESLQKIREKFVSLQKIVMHDVSQLWTWSYFVDIFQKNIEVESSKTEQVKKTFSEYKDKVGKVRIEVLN